MKAVIESWRNGANIVDIFYDDDTGKHSVVSELEGVRSMPQPASDYWHARELADKIIGVETPKVRHK